MDLFTHLQVNVLLQLIQLFIHHSVARVCLEIPFDQENNCCSTCPDLCVHITDFIFHLPSILSLSIWSKDCVTSQNTLRCVESIRPSWLELQHQRSEDLNIYKKLKFMPKMFPFFPITIFLLPLVE